MTTRFRRATWSLSEYTGRARVAHAVAHHELVVSSPLAESTDLPRSEKNVVGHLEGGSDS
jgi:hypothetical protein